MTIVEIAVGVLIGILTRDMANNLYYEARYHIRKKTNPKDYTFSIKNLEEEEN